MNATRPSATETPVDHTPGQSREMSVMEHLGELRQRIITCVWVLTVTVLAAFVLSRPVIEAFKWLAPVGVTFVQLSPGEVLMASFKLSFLVGVALASPVILYQTLRFVLPGLQAHERRFVWMTVFSGTLLFLGGVAFAYFAVIPPALGFLMDYGQDIAENQMSIARFIDFCTSLLILTGIMFELPMVLFFLSFTGLVSSGKLLRHWRGAIVGILLLSAVLTPSQDPFTMLIVGGALMGLYLVSILPIRLMGR